MVHLAGTEMVVEWSELTVCLAETEMGVGWRE